MGDVSGMQFLLPGAASLSLSAFRSSGLAAPSADLVEEPILLGASRRAESNCPVRLCAFIRNLPFSGYTSGTVNVPFGPSDFFLRTKVSSDDITYTIDVSEVR